MGLHVSENWSGGRIAYSRVFPTYTLKVHEPVWDGINHDGSTGFVQVDWLFTGGESHIIGDQEVAFRKGGAADFRISFDPQSEKIDFKAYNLNIIAVMDKANLAWFTQMALKTAAMGFLSNKTLSP